METFTYGSTRASGCNSPGPLTRPIAGINGSSINEVYLTNWIILPLSCIAMPQLHHRNKFFLYASYAFLVIVLVGFSPTFYLRAFFDVPAIPLYIYAHGAALTAWYIWLCVQTTVVSTGRIALHRSLGAIGIAFGTLVLLSGTSRRVGVCASLAIKVWKHRFRSSPNRWSCVGKHRYACRIRRILRCSSA